MDRQDEQVSGPLASEVVVALRDLARMAEHAGSAVSDTPGSVASMLLERLLVLCAAQHGALLLTGYPSRESADDRESSVSSSRILHTFALHGMSEEEAHSLLQLFPSGDASIQTSSGERSWNAYRLPLTVPFVQQQGYEEPGRATIEQETGQTTQPLQAVLLLGWTWQELGLYPNGNGYVTIAWGLYALSLIAASLRLDRNRVLMLCGLSTLFAVAAKLFLIDLQYLEAVWRILLFLGFGGLFLLLSYVFQGFTKRPETRSRDIPNTSQR